MSEQSIPKTPPFGMGCARAFIRLVFALVLLAGIVFIFAMAFQIGMAQSNTQFGGFVIFGIAIGGGALWIKLIHGTIYPRVMDIWEDDIDEEENALATD